MTVTARAEDVLAAVRALAPAFSARAREAEDLRTMPRDLVDACREAGLFNLVLPAELGGLGCDPLTTIRVVEEASRADGSAGWTIGIGNTSAFVAWLEPDVARELSGGGAVFAGALAALGKAKPVDGGFRISGRWPFNSGVPHCDWLVSGVRVSEGGHIRTRPDGIPDFRFAFYPVSQGQIVDTWHASGLKGTGSHDVAATDVFVPEERTCMPFFSDARCEGPLARLPFWNLLMILLAGFPLGVARRALDEFSALAKKKSRSTERLSLADDHAIQVEYAVAEGKVRAARAFVFEAVADAWRTLESGDRVTLEQRANVTLSALNASRACAEAVDAVFHRAGGGALYDESPLQRCFRDIHAGGQHAAVSLETWKRAARGLWGEEPLTQQL